MQRTVLSIQKRWQAKERRLNPGAPRTVCSIIHCFGRRRRFRLLRLWFKARQITLLKGLRNIGKLRQGGAVIPPWTRILRAETYFKESKLTS
jgi:hypothetical protein